MGLFSIKEKIKKKARAFRCKFWVYLQLGYSLICSIAMYMYTNKMGGLIFPTTRNDYLLAKV